MGRREANICGDNGAHVQPGNVGLGVLLEVELAALPGHRGKDGLAGGGHAGMGVANDELDAVEAARDERGEEGAPVDFGFTQLDADAEDGAFAVGADAHGDEHGAVHEHAAVAHFLVAGIHDEIAESPQRTLAPELQFAVELRGAGADLRGADMVAAEFLDDFGDLAGGDSLDVHLPALIGKKWPAISLRSVPPLRA